MTLSARYQAFLASPSTAALADNASLHYITTLTSIQDAPAIVKHLSVQEKLLKKKEQKVLSAIENSKGQLCADLEITIEFVAGGGAYLPGLDDNFVADRTVTLPMIHIVSFDKTGEKIVQIRQYWDQGSLLKQIEVIGARARNWPIRDGKEQLKLIASATSSTQPESAASSRPSTAASRGPDEVSISSRRTTNNAMNDPHASLSLFENRQPEEQGEFESHPKASRVPSAKPPPRNLGELFVGEPGTPTRNTFGKAGGGKNFQPNRLFDEDEEPEQVPMSVKTNAKKYDHFEFDDGENQDTPKVQNPAKSTNQKHQSQWDFEDFVTPEKLKTKIQSNNVRNFGWNDDEQEEPSSPVHREIVHKPRKDADTHFEFKDDGTPDADRKKPTTSKGRQHNNGLGLYKDHVMGGDERNEFDTPRADAKGPLNDVTHIKNDIRKKPTTSKGRQHNNGLGLYKDHVMGGDERNEFDTPRADAKGPLNDVTHIKNDIRQKDFGSHWDMKDNSPSAQKADQHDSKLTQNQKKALKTMDANWSNYEPSPQQSKIKIAGNGMGGRSTGSSFNLFEEDPEAGKKENAGIKSMGNGMGGRKGAASSFNWDF